jgi:hypothetical protein
LSYPDQNINCKQQVLLESAKHMILYGFIWMEVFEEKALDFHFSISS